MPFVYRDTVITENPVETYADLLAAVKIAVEISTTLNDNDDINDIKQFYDWLSQLPVEDPDRFNFDLNFKEEHTIKDSKSSHRDITEYLHDEIYCAYVIAKRVWVVSGQCLLQLRQYKDDPRSVVVPLWDPRFEAGPLSSCTDCVALYYNIVYEVAPNVTVIMDGECFLRTVVDIISISTDPIHIEFVENFKSKGECSLELPNSTTFTVCEDGIILLLTVGPNYESRAYPQ